MRKIPLLAAVILLAAVLTACGSDEPPTIIYVVYSPTPAPATADALTATAQPVPETSETDETDTTPTIPASDPATTATAAPVTNAPDTTAQATETAAGAAPTSAPPQTATTATTAATLTATPRPTLTATAAPARTVTVTPPPTVTPAPDIFPTNTVTEVQLAEQVFEHGRMFWIRYNRQIWVMIEGETPYQGDWFCYNDTFEEGEPEIDPSIVPPADRYQPRRGFGKLWRNLAEIRDRLGWAITPEFELTSAYTYIPGGTVEDGKYYPGPGEHRLNTLYNEPISFFETEIRGDCQGGTWRMPTSH